MTDPGTGASPYDVEAERAAQRSRRRAAARLHHPDRGGDPEAFIRALRDAETPDLTAAAAPLVTVTVSTRSRVLRAVSTTRKHVVADLRRRIPRSLPGSRRYGQL